MANTTTPAAPAAEASPSGITLNDFQLSFIWTETLFHLLDGRLKSGPLESFRSREAFAPAFNTIAGSTATVGPLSLTVPWEHPAGQHFWTYYLAGQRPGDVNGETAWTYLVPLRGRVDRSNIAAPWFDGRFWAEAYYYPYGFSLVMTFRSSGAWTLAESVDQCMNITRTGRFDVTDESGSTQTLSLAALADALMVRIRSNAWQAGLAPANRSTEPFTVFTAIRGSGVDPVVPVAADGDIHRALEALTRWSVSWRKDELSELEGSMLGIRNAPAGHTLYAQSHGRVVWFPESFSMDPGTSHALACYHRNLTFLSMQIESLSGLITETARILRKHEIPSVQVTACAKNAARLLAQLYEGDEFATYRSWSPKRHLHDLGIINDLNLVIDRLNVAVLPISVEA